MGLRLVMYMHRKGRSRRRRAWKDERRDEESYIAGSIEMHQTSFCEERESYREKMRDGRRKFGTFRVSELSFPPPFNSSSSSSSSFSFLLDPFPRSPLQLWDIQSSSALVLSLG